MRHRMAESETTEELEFSVKGLHPPEYSLDLKSSIAWLSRAYGVALERGNILNFPTSGWRF